MSSSLPQTLTAPPFPPRTNWRQAMTGLGGSRAQSTLLGGSFVMLLGSTAVSGVNFAYNIVTARLLGPAAFGHASVAVTLLMLASAITLAFQLVCAKFVARNSALEAKLAIVRGLARRAWMVSAALAVAIVLASGPVSRYLQLPSRAIILLLAVGILFYIPLGVKRGALQGTCAFPRLTSNFLLEASVKFLAAFLLVELFLLQAPHLALLGAVAAVSISVMMAYFLPPLTPELRTAKPALLADTTHCIPASFREGMQAIVFFIGQVLINNIDIVLVKHFFPAREAGLYAAVALVGRVVYFAAWSVVSAMFPISAGARRQRESIVILTVPLFFVSLIAVGFVLVTGWFPHLIVNTLFGAGFSEAERLLSFYAAATGAYALSVVLMAYEMSRRIANTGWLQLVFSGLVIAGIYIFHSTLRQVVVVQLVLMVVLLVAVSIPVLRLQSIAAEEVQEAA